MIRQMELKNEEEMRESVQDILNMDKALQEYDYIIMLLIKFLNELTLAPTFQRGLI